MIIKPSGGFAEQTFIYAFDLDHHAVCTLPNSDQNI